MATSVTDLCLNAIWVQRSLTKIRDSKQLSASLDDDVLYVDAVFEAYQILFTSGQVNRARVSKANENSLVEYFKRLDLPALIDSGSAPADQLQSHFFTNEFWLQLATASAVLLLSNHWDAIRDRYPNILKKLCLHAANTVFSNLSDGSVDEAQRRAETVGGLWNTAVESKFQGATFLEFWSCEPAFVDGGKLYDEFFVLFSKFFLTSLGIERKFLSCLNTSQNGMHPNNILFLGEPDGVDTSGRNEGQLQSSAAAALHLKQLEFLIGTSTIHFQAYFDSLADVEVPFVSDGSCKSKAFTFTQFCKCQNAACGAARILHFGPQTFVETNPCKADNYNTPRLDNSKFSCSFVGLHGRCESERVCSGFYEGVVNYANDMGGELLAFVEQKRSDSFGVPGVNILGLKLFLDAVLTFTYYTELDTENTLAEELKISPVQLPYNHIPPAIANINRANLVADDKQIGSFDSASLSDSGFDERKAAVWLHKMRDIFARLPPPAEIDGGVCNEKLHDVHGLVSKKDSLPMDTSFSFTEFEFLADANTFKHFCQQLSCLRALRLSGVEFARDYYEWTFYQQQPDAMDDTLRPPQLKITPKNGQTLAHLKLFFQAGNEFHFKTTHFNYVCYVTSYANFEGESVLLDIIWADDATSAIVIQTDDFSLHLRANSRNWLYYKYAESQFESVFMWPAVALLATFFDYDGYIRRPSGTTMQTGFVNKCKLYFETLVSVATKNTKAILSVQNLEWNTNTLVPSFEAGNLLAMDDTANRSIFQNRFDMSTEDTGFVEQNKNFMIVGEPPMFGQEPNAPFLQVEQEQLLGAVCLESGVFDLFQTCKQRNPHSFFVSVSTEKNSSGINTMIYTAQDATPKTYTVADDDLFGQISDFTKNPELHDALRRNNLTYATYLLYCQFQKSVLSVMFDKKTLTIVAFEKDNWISCETNSQLVVKILRGYLRLLTEIRPVNWLYSPPVTDFYSSREPVVFDALNEMYTTMRNSEHDHYEFWTEDSHWDCTGKVSQENSELIFVYTDFKRLFTISHDDEAADEALAAVRTANFAKLDKITEGDVINFPIRQIAAQLRLRAQSLYKAQPSEWWGHSNVNVELLFCHLVATTLTTTSTTEMDNLYPSLDFLATHQPITPAIRKNIVQTWQRAKEATSTVKKVMEAIAKYHAFFAFTLRVIDVIPFYARIPGTALKVSPYDNYSSYPFVTARVKLHHLRVCMLLQDLLRKENLHGHEHYKDFAYLVRYKRNHDNRVYLREVTCKQAIMHRVTDEPFYLFGLKRITCSRVHLTWSRSENLWYRQQVEANLSQLLQTVLLLAAQIESISNKKQLVQAFKKGIEIEQQSTAIEAAIDPYAVSFAHRLWVQNYIRCCYCKLKIQGDLVCILRWVPETDVQEQNLGGNALPVIVFQGRVDRAFTLNKHEVPKSAILQLEKKGRSDTASVGNADLFETKSDKENKLTYSSWSLKTIPAGGGTARPIYSFGIDPSKGEIQAARLFDIPVHRNNKKKVEIVAARTLPKPGKEQQKIAYKVEQTLCEAASYNVKHASKHSADVYTPPSTVLGNNDYLQQPLESFSETTNQRAEISLEAFAVSTAQQTVTYKKLYYNKVHAVKVLATAMRLESLCTVGSVDLHSPPQFAIQAAIHKNFRNCLTANNYSAGVFYRDNKPKKNTFKWAEIFMIYPWSCSDDLPEAEPIKLCQKNFKDCCIEIQTLFTTYHHAVSSKSSEYEAAFDNFVNSSFSQWESLANLLKSEPEQASDIPKWEANLVRYSMVMQSIVKSGLKNMSAKITSFCYRYQQLLTCLLHGNMAYILRFCCDYELYGKFAMITGSKQIKVGDATIYPAKLLHGCLVDFVADADVQA